MKIEQVAVTPEIFVKLSCARASMNDTLTILESAEKFAKVIFCIEGSIERQLWSDGGLLPPIGTVCEVVSPGYRSDRFNRFVGKRVTVVAHDVIDGDPVAVFRMAVDGQIDEQDYHAMIAKCFRPVKTPEQIAEEERKSGIDEMKDVFDSNFEGCRRDGLEALWDAGYRKQVNP